MIEDVVHALRSLTRDPRSSLSVASILALGIAASVSTFTLGDSVLLRPMPYPHGSRLLTLYESNREAEIPQMLVSYPTFQDLLLLESLESVAAYQPSLTLTLGGEPEAVRVRTNFVSASYFELLGAKASLGRLFAPEEHAAPMAARVAVLSHGLWTRRFGADPEIVGRRVELNDEPFVVVGVGERSFDDLPAAGQPTELWLPLEAYPVSGYPWSLIERRQTRFLATVARLAPGVPLEGARDETATLAARLEDEFPEAHAGYALVAERVHGFQVALLRPAIVTLVGAALFLLLIGCANAANLLLVKAAQRRHEMALHLALGSSRRRIFRRLLIEGLLVALLAAAVGVGLGWLLTQALLGASPVSLPDHIEVSLSWRVVGAALLIATATGVLFALAPAVEGRSVEASSVLRGRGAAVLSLGERWRRAVIVLEVASAVVLLLGGLLTAGSFRTLASTSPGFDTARLLTLRTGLPASRYGDDDALRAFAHELHRRLGELPGVESALVWAPDMPAEAEWYRAFAPADRVVAELGEALAARYHLVSPGALEALGIPLLLGRTLRAADRADTRPVAVVSESAALALFGDDDPLGRSLHRWRSAESSASETHYEVVGIVADTLQGGRAVSGLATADVYFSFDQLPSRELNLLLRSRHRPEQLVGGVRETLRSLDGGLALYDISTMRERLAMEEEQSRFAAFLTGCFAVVASLLAGLGLYSVVAYWVRQRTREVGIRMAIGGAPKDIVGWIGRQALRLVGSGLALGVGGALAIGQLLRGLLFEVDPADPRAIAAVLVLMLLVSACAVFAPLRGASRIDPAEALRST